MGSNQAPYQVHGDNQTLGKYPIRVSVRVRVRVRVRIQQLTEQHHELRIIINLGRRIIVKKIVYYDCLCSIKVDNT